MSSASALDQLCAAACNTGGGVEPPAVAQACQIQVLEVDAFASVHDLIHAAILSSRGAASLKEVYEVCQTNGRIAYKRAGGSRFITSNDHWKSQIRHALYTSDRFERVPGNSELWQVTAAYADTQPQMAKVLVRADEGAAGAAAQPLSLPPPHHVSAGGSGGAGARAARLAPSPAARRKPGAGPRGGAAAGRGGGGRGRGRVRGAKSRSSSLEDLPTAQRARRKRRRGPEDSDEDVEEEAEEEEEEEEEQLDYGIEEEEGEEESVAAAAAAGADARRGTSRAAAGAGLAGRGSVRSGQRKAPAQRSAPHASFRDLGSVASGYNSSPGESDWGGEPVPPVTGTPRGRALASAAAAAVAAAAALDPSPRLPATAAPIVPPGARAPRGSRGSAFAAPAAAAAAAVSGPGGSLGTPDPSLLRWGSTGRRSSALQEPSACSLLQVHHSAAGAAQGAGGAGTGYAAAAAAAVPPSRHRALSAEAESPPLAEAKVVGRRAAQVEEGEEAETIAGRPSKRQAAPPLRRQLDVTLTPSLIERPASAGALASPQPLSPLASPLESWSTAAAARQAQHAQQQAQQLQQLAAARGLPPGMLLAHPAAGALSGLSPMPFQAMLPPFFPTSPALVMAAAGPFLPAHVVQQQAQQHAAAAQQAQHSALAQVHQALRALQRVAGAQQWAQAPQQAEQPPPPPQQQQGDYASSEEHKQPPHRGGCMIESEPSAQCSWDFASMCAP